MASTFRLGVLPDVYFETDNTEDGPVERQRVVYLIGASTPQPHPPSPPRQPPARSPRAGHRAQPDRGLRDLAGRHPGLWFGPVRISITHRVRRCVQKTPAAARRGAAAFFHTCERHHRSQQPTAVHQRKKRLRQDGAALLAIRRQPWLSSYELFRDLRSPRKQAGPKAKP